MIHKVLCIGNSHTAGFPHFDPSFGGDPKSSYQFWLQKNMKLKIPELSLELSNQGICGQTSQQIIMRLQRELNQSKTEYNTVILCAGANDMALGYSPQTIYNNIIKGVNISEKFRLNVLVHTIPPMNWSEVEEDIMQLNALIENISGKSYHLVDVYSVLEINGRLASKYDSGDGVHLSEAGYSAVGKCISEILHKLLDMPQQ